MKKYARVIGRLSMQVIGVDISDRRSRVCIMSRDGQERFDEFETSPEGVRRFFGELERSRIAMETGTHSPWMSELLEEMGHEVLVAEAAQLELITKGKKKSDTEDAWKLAHLAAVDPGLLSPIRHRGRDTRLDLAVLRGRSQLVEVRTQLLLHVRGVVKSFGLRLANHSPEAFPRKVREALSGEAVLGVVEPLLAVIERLTKEIRQLDRWIGEVVQEKYPEALLLQQVNGVGPVVSLTYVLTLEDPHRFRRSRDVGAYVGLVPRLHESGEQEGSRRLSKAGDEELRRVLIQAAHHVLGRWGKDSRLRRWGLALAERRGRKKAVAAVARKLAVILHRIWVTGAAWDPEHGAVGRSDREVA